MHIEVETLSIHEELQPYFTLQTRKSSKGGEEYLVTEKQQKVNQQSGEDLDYRTFRCPSKAMDFMQREYTELTGRQLPADKDEQAGGPALGSLQPCQKQDD